MTPEMNDPERLASRLESLMIHALTGFLMVDDRGWKVQIDVVQTWVPSMIEGLSYG